MNANYEYMIAVMTAASQGAKIECLHLDDPDDSWSETNNPRWDWMHFNYRIKGNED